MQQFFIFPLLLLKWFIVTTFILHIAEIDVCGSFDHKCEFLTSLIIAQNISIFFRHVWCGEIMYENKDCIT